MGGPPAPANVFIPPHYTARALIGWMTPEQAILSMSGNQAGVQGQEEYAVRAENARAAVAARPVGVDQTELRTAAPPELQGHIDALRQNPLCVPYFNEGWEVAVVDLSRVCAAQPQVRTVHANERVGAANAEDIVSLAAISLPSAVESQFPALFDPTKNAWIFSSTNPNLRVAGSFRGGAQHGYHGFGFMVGIATSFLQVAFYRGRHILRDGYHRACGFLNRGITYVPALVRDVARYEQLGLPQGMLPQDSFLGERPPLLRDYWDDAVSADVETPSTQKLVLVQAIELSTLG